MDLSLERDSSILGSLFQHIINDMKNTSPLWEDFVAKAAKLHACLRAAIQAIAAYLDAFQKIADAATNSRGASKEIGTALTRVCLRHKAVETRLKTFTAAIMDYLVQPLQEKLEDWKRTVATIDKEHAKEYKRCRTELKKRSSDTLRLQKKARKGQSDTIQSLMDSHMQDVTLRRAELEEVEKKSLRAVMIEERLRYCTFVHMLQPVVKEECEVMSELGHLQEAMQSIANVTKDPNVLPASSEELIQDTKVSMSLYPESPGGGSGSQGACSNSLGSRKSSVCSISSMNSSGSSNSPGHHHYPRSLSQLISPAIRLKPGESSDSGFCSSPALTTQTSNVTNQSHAASTWPPHSQDADPLSSSAAERPHTISTTYEKGHQRPPLTVYTFQNPETIHEGGGGGGSSTPNGNSTNAGGNASGQNTPSTQKPTANTLNRPPLPVRCSSLERPLSGNNANANASSNANRNGGVNLRHCPSPIPAHITKELSTHHAQQQHQQQQQQQQQQHLQHSQQSQLQQPLPSSPPTYVNMSELANMAALKITNQQQQQQQHQQTPLLQQQNSIESISSQHSNESGGSNHHQQQHQQQQQQQRYSSSIPNTPHPPMKSARSHSTSSSSVSSHTPSLHSHPSLESTIATPLVASQTPTTTSSGSSTPQNHYSPLLTNSPSSTAAGTPSGASITSSGGGGGGMAGNFIYNVCSPTPPASAATPPIASTTEAALQITESESSNPNQTQIQQHNTTQPSNQTPSTIPSANVSAADLSNSQNQNSTKNTDIDTDSPTIIENDERSRASVLQKASMFEKQAAAVAASAVANTSSSQSSLGVAGSRTSGDSGIYGTRRMDDQQHHYRSGGGGGSGGGQQANQESGDQMDVDKSFEDSIQELNNLIGELDSFQREIDASKEQQQQQQQHQQQQHQHQQQQGRIYGSIDPPFPIEAINIATTTSTTPHPATTIISSSNQTNSSGCGTDISDTTSDELAADTRSVTSLNFHSGSHHHHHHSHHNSSLRSSLKQQANYNSDSELSRCCVSETSSLICGSGIGDVEIGGAGGGGGGNGYENPTFAHFTAAAATAASATASAGDSISQAGSDLCQQQERQAYIINADESGDSSSAVVVIYDHQIPITPDIDYVKQNSEIVLLRTKDPQQQQNAQQQEMRELQQLPANLAGSPPPDSPPTTPSGRNTPHTATIAPPKQRLSSFRASSEQQLQLLGLGVDNGGGGGGRYHHHHHHQQQHGKGTLVEGVSRSSFKQSKADTVAMTTTAKLPNEKTTSLEKRLPPMVPSDTIIRRKLPPKPPTLSIFNGSANFTALETAKNKQNSNASINSSSSSGSSSHGILDNKVHLLCEKPIPIPIPIQQQQSPSPQQQAEQVQKAQIPTLTPPLTFKADLDAKLRKQKQKILQKEQEQQQQQHSQTKQKTYSSSSNNCNANNNNNKNNDNNISNCSKSSCKLLSQANNHSIDQHHQNGSQELLQYHHSHHQHNNNNNNINNDHHHSNHEHHPHHPHHHHHHHQDHQQEQQNLPQDAEHHHHTQQHDLSRAHLLPINLLKQNHSINNIVHQHQNNIDDQQNHHHNHNQHHQQHQHCNHENHHDGIENIAQNPTNPSIQLSFASLVSEKMLSPSMLHLNQSSLPALVAPPPFYSNNSLISTSQSPKSPNVVPLVDPTTATTTTTTTISSCVSSNHLLCSSSNAVAASSNMVAPPNASATTKPYISPRPASLSGGNGTRIPRRSSINTAKPPPPVRRSSSVTPSHNASTGSSSQNEQQQQQQQPSQQQQQQTPQLHTQISNLSQQNKQHAMMSNSTESLPPPPAYLLDARHATPPLLQNGDSTLSAAVSTSTSTPTPTPISTSTSTSTSTHMPNSALKVAETVKALSAMRHQPASPNAAMRRLQQQQQQQQQPPPLQQQHNPTTTTHQNSLQNGDDDGEDEYNTGFYNPYIEVGPYPQTTQSSSHAQGPKISQTPLSPSPIYHHQKRQQIDDDLQYFNKSINYMTSSPSSSLLTSPPPLLNAYERAGDIQYSASASSTSSSGQINYNNSYSQLNQYHQQQLLRANQNQPQSPELLNPQYLQQQQQQQHQQEQYHQQTQSQHQFHKQQQSHYYNLQQQQHQQHQQQQQQQQLSNTESIYGNSASFRTTSPGIYAQPKIVTNMSSFRSASPGPIGHHSHHATPHATPPHPMPPTQPKTNPNLIAQLNARLSSKQQQNSANENIYGSSTITNSPQQQQQGSSSAHSEHNQPNQPNHHQHQQQQQHHQNPNEAIYARNYAHQQQHQQHQQQQQQLQHTYDDYVGTNIEKAGSIRSKTKAEFLENLNAKLAKQTISGRAFAVRSLINSKALPDPRVCHESLMDQIKRGATLKRNQKINDRSAPKIL